MAPERLRRRRGTAGAALCAALGLLLPLAGVVSSSAQDSLTVTLRPRDVWPPAPVTDLIGTPGAEGQMLLEWTAPDSNSNALALRTPVSAYQLRVATFAVASVGGSTTAWWASAVDVRALPSPAQGGNPPTPGEPGVLESMLLTFLEPGVTYYAMVISSDSSGLVSGADTNSLTASQARALIYDATPPTPGSLSAVQTGRSTFTVTWSSVTAYDLDFYRIYLDSAAPYDFVSDVFTATADSTALTAQIGGLSTGTYALRVTAVDKGAPSFGGLPLESLPSATVTAEIRPAIRPPQTPFGVSLTTAGAASTLRWLPVHRFADGAAFVDPEAPTVDELTGYRVYRGTTPVSGNWTEMASFSTGTLAWTDLASGPQYYYGVRAENATGQSRLSALHAVATRNIFVLAPDDKSYLEVPQSISRPMVSAAAGDSVSTYLVEASSRPLDLGGRVLKSLDFAAWKDGTVYDPNFAFEGMGWLKLRYELGAAGTVAVAGLSPAGLEAAATSATPDNMSVYWYNGNRWVQLYGRLDRGDQTLTVQTKFSGRYQLRTVERVQAFNFNQAGISNRFLTPNGDGKNDDVVFTYDNPRDSAVTARILDIRGKTVVSDLPPGPTSSSRLWNGTAGGRPVPGGVYIYQIESEGKVFAGTVVVIR